MQWTPTKSQISGNLQFQVPQIQTNSPRIHQKITKNHQKALKWSTPADPKPQISQHQMGIWCYHNSCKFWTFHLNKNTSPKTHSKISYKITPSTQKNPTKSTKWSSSKTLHILLGSSKTKSLLQKTIANSKKERKKPSKP